jgi:tryptophan 2,3-dioxygenase
MDISPEIQTKIQQLIEKYDAQGQDINAYLEGLLHSKTINYWDYIQVDTLLSLQKTYSIHPDETIFLMYHQITELYFKLCLHEFEQIAEHPNLTKEFFVSRVTRINRYFESLTKSFEIMVDGMEREQFLKFRMSLHPASGFQSGQYRKIEIYSTDFLRLVDKDKRELFTGQEDIETLFEEIYWKAGATETATGKKTLTLVQFEERYKDEFIALGEKVRTSNLWQCYLRLSEVDRNSSEVLSALKQNDVNVNVNWPLMHYKSAVRYLNMGKDDVPATGGTNWQKYLPPRFQKRIFYPQIWSDEEVENWGKAWVESVLA